MLKTLLRVPDASFMVLCSFTDHCDMSYCIGVPARMGVCVLVRVCAHTCVCVRLSVSDATFARSGVGWVPISFTTDSFHRHLWHVRAEAQTPGSRAENALINLTNAQGVITLHLLSFSLSLFHSAPV